MGYPPRFYRVKSGGVSPNPLRPFRMGSDRLLGAAGGRWVGNRAGWPTPPRPLSSGASKYVKNRLFSLF